MSLHDILAGVADELMFDTELAAKVARYSIRYSDGSNAEFEIPFVEDDDDSRRELRNTIEDRRRTVIGWIPATYSNSRGDSVPMPVPDDQHSVLPAGQCEWFQFQAIHERNAAGFLCTFTRADLRAVGGFDSARR